MNNTTKALLLNTVISLVLYLAYLGYNWANVIWVMVLIMELIVTCMFLPRSVASCKEALARIDQTKMNQSKSHPTWYQVIALIHSSARVIALLMIGWWISAGIMLLGMLATYKLWMIMDKKA